MTFEPQRRKDRQERTLFDGARSTAPSKDPSPEASIFPLGCVLAVKKIMNEVLAEVTYSVIPANPGSGPGQAPESRIA